MFEEDIKIVRGKRNVAINQGVRPQDEVFADNVQMYVEARAGLTAHKEGNTTRFSQI
jgi:hypothetical protein